MKRNSKTLRADALKILEKRWSSSAGITLVYLAISVGIPLAFSFSVSEAFGNIVQLLLLPMNYGFVTIFLQLTRDSNKKAEISDLFDCFKEYGRIFQTLFLVGIYTFLWTLLLIVPGIIKSYSYILVPYILKDEPDLSNNAAIERSMAMMQGHKMDLFRLHLSFIGWILLSLLTFGIGFLWLSPYINTAQSCFYEDIKNEFMQNKLSGNA